MRCSCHACGTQGIGVVIVKEVSATIALAESEAELADARPLQVDDVLVAHEVLRGYVGDVHGLFEGIPGR